MEKKIKDKSVLVEDLDINVVIDFFSRLPRQGIGSESDTLKAINMILNHREENLTENHANTLRSGYMKPDSILIADMGCGTGGQSIALAKADPRINVEAVDLFPAMIEVLNRRVAEEGLCYKVSGIIGSMDDLHEVDNKYDVIWSEGSIYNIGFEKGMNLWRNYLKPGGFVAVSDMVWLTEERPPELEDYLTRNVPEITSPSVKMRQIEKAGYTPVSAFLQSESSWEDSFYTPAYDLLEQFLREYDFSQPAKEFTDRMREEIDYYRRYKQYFGYMFYVARKQ